LATLHYGIESKKALSSSPARREQVKTILLHKLMRNLEGSIHTVFIFNTYLTFTELLRLTLRDLGLATRIKDRLSKLEEHFKAIKKWPSTCTGRRNEVETVKGAELEVFLGSLDDFDLTQVVWPAVRRKKAEAEFALEAIEAEVRRREEARRNGGGARNKK
jgi:hypothetical protein